MASFKTTAVTLGINGLLHLEKAYRASHLDMIEEYFTNPPHVSHGSDSNSENELDGGNCNKIEY